MARVTRRTLIASTGAGVAAAGVIVAAPGVIAGVHHKAVPASARSVSPPKNVPSVAYVRDAARGEVVLMVGEREVVRTDLALVAYLGRLCDSESA